MREARSVGLWAPRYRTLTTGLVLTVTFIASEALAVVTVMPIVARDLSGLRSYGWVFSAFMLGSLVGIVAAGREADRMGPARPYVAGLILFCCGLTTAGLAPSMGVLIVGRMLQGLGAGAVPAIAYVAIGRTLPDSLRPRMMAVLSTAWVAPGLAGPAVSLAVARAFGWRWVFLGLLPLVIGAGLLALPALVRLGPPTTAPAAEHRLVDGVRTAIGAGLVLTGLAAGNVAIALALVVAGVVLGLPSLRRLVPAGTLTARRGLPATILARGLLTFAFFGGDAYVTLSIVTARHASTTLAGVAVTGSTLSWTVGAWLQARLSERWEGARLVRLGMFFVLLGLLGMTVVLRPGVPVTAALAAWAVSGLGIGLAYAPISLMMLREAPSGREGWASASLNLVDVLGTAMGVGFGGAAVAAASQAGWALSSGVTVAFVIASTGAVTGLLLVSRLPSNKVVVSH